MKKSESIRGDEREKFAGEKRIRRDGINDRRKKNIYIHIEREREEREGRRGGKRALEVLLKRAKTFSRFFPFPASLARSAKMHPRNCRLQ